MLNPNIFIIGAFGITGIVITLWGLMLIIKARKMRNWSRVEGVIAENMITPHADDLPPQIRFNYSVDGHVYTGTLDIPNSIALSDEVSASYQEKYPAGAKVQVHYDPKRPDQATIEPGIGSDWMIFIVGLMVVAFAISALFYST